MVRQFSDLADNAPKEKKPGRSSTIECDRASPDVLSSRPSMLGQDLHF